MQCVVLRRMDGRERNVTHSSWCVSAWYVHPTVLVALCYSTSVVFLSNSPLLVCSVPPLLFSPTPYPISDSVMFDHRSTYLSRLSAHPLLLLFALPLTRLSAPPLPCLSAPCSSGLSLHLLALSSARLLGRLLSPLIRKLLSAMFAVLFSPTSRLWLVVSSRFL